MRDPPSGQCVRGREPDKYVVASAMAAGVVDEFEVVDVQQRQGERLVGALRPGDLLLQGLRNDLWLFSPVSPSRVA